MTNQPNNSNNFDAEKNANDITNNIGNNSKNFNKKHKKKMKTPLKVLLIILLCFLIIIGSLFGTFLVLRKRGKDRLTSKNGNASFPTDIIDAMENDGEVIYKNGEKYVLNKNIVSFIFMGVDKTDINGTKQNGNAGQADSISLIALDTAEKRVKVLPISRETMVDVDMYSATGEKTGTEKKQLCLAYSYGNGGKTSCENVKKSVSRLLYGMDIKSYYAMELEGVSKLTDKIGGIDLTALETLNGSYSIIKNESVNLKGGKAIFYIQERSNDLTANQGRMARQKQFMSALTKKCGKNILSNFTNLVTYYNVLKPYSYTDLSLSDVTYLASECLSTKLLNEIEYLDISGNTSLGKDNHSEFNADSNSVYNAVVDIFYKKTTDGNTSK